MKKPRIRKRYGVWLCAIHDPFVCATGETPEEAFKAWETQMKERGLAVAQPTQERTDGR